MIYLKIARVFPRRTKATPDDALAFTTPPTKELSDIDEIHISVTFSYDKQKAEQLAEAWSKTGLPVKIGGVAFNDSGGEFTPGLYIRKGYVITSRGCHNNCWFCDVNKREGGIRELKITEGYNVLDSNLLACSEGHIKAVFDMLSHQAERPIFSGGLDTRLLREWHVELLRQVRTERMYFAYDCDDDLEPLIQAGRLLRNGGIKDSSGHKLKCYVLIGYDGDTFEKAEKRLIDTWRAGFFPYSMLYRNESGETAGDWRKFQRTWTRPQIVYHKLKEISHRYL